MFLLLIFGVFSMLNYEKRSSEYDFPLTFDHQKKLMELWLFFQKTVRITPMEAWWGKHHLAIFGFLWMLNYEKQSIEYNFHLLLTARKNTCSKNSPQITRRGFFHHAIIIVNFTFFRKMAIIPSIFSGGQKQMKNRILGIVSHHLASKKSKSHKSKIPSPCKDWCNFQIFFGGRWWDYHNSVNFFWRSKVNWKSYSGDCFL